MGIAQNEIGVLSGQGSSSTAGLLGDARSGAPLIHKLAEIGIPQEQAELYAQGPEHGLGLVVTRVDNDRAEQAGPVMERQPVVDIEARAEQWVSQGEQEQTLQAIEEELQPGSPAYQRRGAAGRGAHPPA